MSGVKQSPLPPLIELKSNLGCSGSMPLSACKRVYVVPAVKVLPVMVTEILPDSDATPETSTLSALAGTTWHSMVATVPEKVRSPSIPSVPLLGASVPSTVTTGVEGDVVVTVPFPVNVPEVYTRTVAALTLEPFVTLRTPTAPAMSLYPATSNRPLTVHIPPPSIVTDPFDGGSSPPVSDPMDAVALLISLPPETMNLPLPR